MISADICLLNIKIDMDLVVIEGVEVPRPERISRSDWLAFWEYAALHRSEIIRYNFY